MTICGRAAMYVQAGACRCKWGELIIYAPHISEVSVSHGDLIEQSATTRAIIFWLTGKNSKTCRGEFSRIQPTFAAIGTMENGVEKPRVTVTLAYAQFPPKPAPK
jgi:hypothetical protein